MRCKKCKKIIESENLFRCPHCGKPVVKKKKADPKELMSIASFAVVSSVYVLLNFMGLFFECDYYNMTATVIGIVVYLVAFPFAVGNYKGLKRTTVSLIGIIVSLPLIANWLVGVAEHPFIMNELSSAYFFTLIGIYVLTDMILLLKAFGTIEKSEILKWIFLAFGLIGFVFTIVYFAITKEIKGLAIAILAVNAFVPSYVAYHTASRDSKEESMLDI